MTERLDDDRTEEPLPLVESGVIVVSLVANAAVAFLVVGYAVCGLESAEVIPPRLWLVALPVAGAAGIVALTQALLVNLARWVRFQRGPDALWRDSRCPRCGHSMPPKLASPKCSECGSSLERPVPPRRSARLAVAFFVAAGGGGLASLLWLGMDSYRFRLSVASDPNAPAARARAWPFESAGLVYDPIHGFAAHE